MRYALASIPILLLIACGPPAIEVMTLQTQIDEHVGLMESHASQGDLPVAVREYEQALLDLDKLEGIGGKPEGMSVAEAREQYRGLLLSTLADHWSTIEKDEVWVDDPVARASAGKAVEELGDEALSTRWKKLSDDALQARRAKYTGSYLVEDSFAKFVEAAEPDLAGCTARALAARYPDQAFHADQSKDEIADVIAGVVKVRVEEEYAQYEDADERYVRSDVKIPDRHTTTVTALLPGGEVTWKSVVVSEPPPLLRLDRDPGIRAGDPIRDHDHQRVVDDQREALQRLACDDLTSRITGGS